MQLQRPPLASACATTTRPQPLALLLAPNASDTPATLSAGATVHDDDDQQQQQQQQIVLLPSPPPSKKTNSTRGKEFRAKRKKYEATLTAIVDSLKREVEDLSFLKGVRNETFLRSRHTLSGSLVRVVQEYYTIFQRGRPNAVSTGQKRLMPSEDGNQLEEKQVAFLHSVMDPELHFGELKGVAAVLDQWQRYTSYHASIRVDVVNMEVSGPEDNPMVVVTSHLHVRFSRDTFKYVFPHVADNEELVQRFIGKEVTYIGVNQYQFSEKGQISIYESDVGFASALLNAGASLSDIALLMNQAKIANHYVLGEEDEDGGNGSEDVSGESADTPRVIELPDSDDQEQDEGVGREKKQVRHDLGEEPADRRIAAASPLRVCNLLSDDSDYNDESECENEPESVELQPSSRLALDFLLS